MACSAARDKPVSDFKNEERKKNKEKSALPLKVINRLNNSHLDI